MPEVLTAPEEQAQIDAELNRLVSETNKEFGIDPAAATAGDQAGAEGGADKAAKRAAAADDGKGTPATDDAAKAKAKADAEAAAAGSDTHAATEKDKGGEKHKKSRFQERQEQIKAELEASKKAKADAESAHKKLEERERQLAEREKKLNGAQAPEFTPEQVLATAKRWETDAQAIEDAAEKRALKAEEAGEYDRADKIRTDAGRQADALRLQAEQAVKYADKLKAAPQQERTLAAAQDLSARYERVAAQTWKDFPEVLAAKNGQPAGPANAAMQQLVAEHGAEIESAPEILPYLAKWAKDRAERDAAKATAARVPELEKAVESGKQRIAELENLVNPAGGGQLQRQPAQKAFEDMTPEEQVAELERQARAASGLPVF